MADEKVSDTVRKALIPLLIGQLWPLAVSAIPTILAYLYLTGSKLIVDPALREKMGEAAGLRAAEFQASAIVQKIEAVYQSL